MDSWHSEIIFAMLAKVRKQTTKALPDDVLPIIFA